MKIDLTPIRRALRDADLDARERAAALRSLPRLPAPILVALDKTLSDCAEPEEFDLAGRLIAHVAIHTAEGSAHAA